jgi:hypothetical protein
MWLRETLFGVGALVLAGVWGVNEWVCQESNTIIKTTKTDIYHLVYNPDIKWGLAKQLDRANKELKEWVCKELKNEDGTSSQIYVEARDRLIKQEIFENTDIFEISPSQLKTILEASECKI